MHPSQMTGLQLLQTMPRDDLPCASISETVPMTMDVIEAGTVHFGTQADRRHLNPLGGVHGGFAATVLDSVTGRAMHPVLGAGIDYGTIDLNVEIVKAVSVDASLVTVGRILHLSHTISVSGGTFRMQDGTLFAHATAMCVIRRP